MKAPHNLRRRDFLLGLGAASAFLPVLPSLILKSRAAEPQAPLRFIFLFTPDGQFEESFFPSSVGEQAFNPNVYYKRLSDFPGPVSTVFGPAFDSLKNEISILRGLDFCHAFPHGEHGEIQFLSSSLAYPEQYMNRGYFGSTIDWILGRSPSFYPTAPQLDAIRHVHWQPLGKPFYYKANYNLGPEALPALNSDQGIFDQVFGGQMGPARAPASSALKTLIADKVLERLNLVRANRRLSSLDRGNLQEHLDIMSGLRARFASGAEQSCTPPPQISPLTLNSQLYSNLFDTTIAAFACDSTRIACINLVDYHDTEHFGPTDHGFSHSDPGSEGAASLGLMRRWSGERIAELIAKLAAKTDIDGTRMLDNTVVVWGSDMTNIHKMESIPIMIAGNARGKLRSGYYIDYRRRPFRHLFGPALGVAYQQMLCTLMHAANVPREEFQSYGYDGTFGHFELTNPYRPPSAYAEVAAQRNDPLPFYYQG
ncbi:MAG TPA: DUF1552 domain-containing protein [Bdellovibrionota bacterium]|nr:DUF1552 domain-containing protein [Bdellovibrionota bacterium]